MTSVQWLQLGVICCVLGSLGIVGNTFNGDLLRRLYGDQPVFRRTKRGKYLAYLIPAYVVLAIGLACLVTAFVLLL